MIKEVALYLRKSREDEEKKDETLNRHETMLTEYCARNGLHISKVYKEIVSGENIANRPEMIKLLDDVAAGLYEGVVCVELERLSRGNPIDQCEILDVFKASQTKIYTLNKVYDLTNEDIDEEYFEFALFMSRREYKTIRRRMLRGRLQATKEGYYIGSHAPYGYDKTKIGNKCALIPNDEAETVRYIFSKYANGVGMLRISNYLNMQGIKSKLGNNWNQKRISEILKNRVYIGEVHSSKYDTWYKGRHDPIIDKDLFDMVQERLKQYTPKVNKDKSLKNPFSGLLYCGCCGNMMKRNINVKYGYDYIVCYRDPNCTNRKNIRLEYVEAEILKALKQALKDYKTFLNASDLSEKRSERDNESNLLKKELKAKESQLDKACTLLEQGVYTIDMFRRRSGSIEQEIDAIKTRLEEIKNAPADKDIEVKKTIPIIKKVLEKYSKLSAEEKNRLLKAIIKTVYINTVSGETFIDVELLL